MKPTQVSHKHQGNEGYHPQTQPKKRFDTKGAHNDKSICSKCCDTIHLEGFQCPAKKYHYKACHKFGHFYQYVLSEKASLFQE